VTVKVARLPGKELANNASGSGPRETLGLEMAPLSPDMRNQLDVPDGMGGVVVRDVRPGSPAYQAGLEAG
jgi:serine protease Do